jgi:nicotinamide phosphoribosyltransferase
MPIHVIEQLMHYAGFEVNEKGFHVLPSHVRVIQGDGIDIDDVNAILGQMLYLKLSASNIAFGMGGGLLQKVNRDTFKFAMKANEIVINGETIPVQKKPSTDATKVSKAGAQMLLRNKKTGEFKTVPRANSNLLRTDGWYNAMQTVYRAHRGATAVIHQSFEEVRENAKVI